MERDIEWHARTIRELEDNQARLVQLSYKGLVSDEVLAREQHRLDGAQKQAGDLLAKAQLPRGRCARGNWMKLSLAPRHRMPTYLRRDARCERRILNQTFFKRILDRARTVRCSA